MDEKQINAAEKNDLQTIPVTLTNMEAFLILEALNVYCENKVNISKGPATEKLLKAYANLTAPEVMSIIDKINEQLTKRKHKQ